MDEQREKIELAIDPKVSHVAVHGFGVDDIPTGNPPPFNKANQTLQAHSGDLLGYQADSKTIYLHRADTKVGNSGSPLLAIDELGQELGFAIGIHTHGGCGPLKTDGNAGTSFTNPGLASAIRNILEHDDENAQDGETAFVK